jgi:hypothetical protein
MEKTTICSDSAMGSVHRNERTRDNHDDGIAPANDSLLIRNLSTDVAQKIKDQVVDVVAHVTFERS